MVDWNDLSVVGDLRVCSMEEQPVLRIGSIDGPDEKTFNNVARAAFLSTGDIAVLDRGNREIKLFDAMGSPLGVLGRRGDGPGEFRDPIGLMPYLADTLAVWDWGAGRITLFSTLDSGVRTIVPRPMVEGPTGVFLAGTDSSPFLIGSHLLRPPGGDGLGRDQFVTLLAFSPDGSLVDTVSVNPYGRLFRLGEGGPSLGQPFFQARTTFATRDGKLFITDGDATEIEVRDLSSRSVVGQVRWTDPDRSVADADVLAYVEELAERSPHLVDRIRRNASEIPVATHFPASQSIIPGEDGSVWVKTYPRPGSGRVRLWWVFGSDGTFDCAVYFHDGFEPFAIRDSSVLGVARDALEVEYVEVRRMIEWIGG